MIEGALPMVPLLPLVVLVLLVILVVVVTGCARTGASQPGTPPHRQGLPLHAEAGRHAQAELAAQHMLSLPPSRQSFQLV